MLTRRAPLAQPQRLALMPAGRRASNLPSLPHQRIATRAAAGPPPGACTRARWADRAARGGRGEGRSRQRPVSKSTEQVCFHPDACRSRTPRRCAPP